MKNGDSKANGAAFQLNGPEQVAPAETYCGWAPDSRVRLRLGPRGLSAEPPVSVPGLLARTVARYPDGLALATKRPDGQWQKTTFRQYQRAVRTCAKAFLKLGLERHHAVCILGFNSEQWFVADLAAIHAGGFAAGIYTTNSAEACFHCLESSRANICVVQDDRQLEKVQSVRSRLPELRAVVQWEGGADRPGVYTWDDMMSLGERETEAELDAVLRSVSVNECCTLVYTSGTVGQPKAVMLSHDNLTWDALAISERVGDFTPLQERLVSFLPLSHVAAQVVDIYVTLMHAVPVYFAQPDALKGSLVDTLREVQPTRFLAVPRVWEKMYEKIMAVGATSGGLKRAIAAWAKDRATQYHTDRSLGYSGGSCGYSVARALVLGRVKAALGLDRCLTFVTAAAPLSPDIKRFFLSLDIPVMDAFGMSEGAGAHSVSIHPKFNLESVGEILNGVETKFGGAASPSGPGEVLLRGRHVFMGYLGDPERTRAALDPEGWLHSGDVGRVDGNNFLFITGRIKELIITAGGENVAPVLIEQTVQGQLPHIGYAVLVGDRRKFLALLVTLKAKVNPETGEAGDELEDGTRRWVAELGSDATTISQVVGTRDASVHKAIEEGIARANRLAISNAQKVQKFRILPADFSLPSGELGPTLKVKRNVVHDKYKDIIEDLYKD